jgi:hypothetical protein
MDRRASETEENIVTARKTAAASITNFFISPFPPWIKVPDRFMPDRFPDPPHGTGKF